MKQAVATTRYVVPMLVKAFTILEVFSSDGPRLSLTEIVSASGIPKASAYRILETLCHLGYISKTKKGLYRLTFRLMDIAGVVKERNLLRRLATPFLEKLQRRTGETVNLGLIEENQVICVEVLESSHTLRMVPRIGSTAPLHATSLVNTIAAYLSPEDLELMMQAGRMRQLTDRTILSDAVFHEELQRVRTLGYALDNQEESVGCTCVGATILDAGGKALGAISISAPSSRAGENRVVRLGKDVANTAKLISDLFRFNSETKVRF